MTTPPEGVTLWQALGPNGRSALKTLGVVALVAACFLVLAIAGCAVGRRESDGAIVLGVEAGKLVETADQAIGAIGGLLPPPFGTIAELALPALGLGALAHGRARGTVKREADDAYDEGKRDAEAAAAARDAAYDEARLREAYKRQPPPVDPGSLPAGGPAPA